MVAGSRDVFGVYQTLTVRKQMSLLKVAVEKGQLSRIQVRTIASTESMFPKLGDAFVDILESVAARLRRLRLLSIIVQVRALIGRSFSVKR